ncbi:MAG: hypothetical protein ACRDRN_23670 [Sciscionella sp.]
MTADPSTVMATGHAGSCCRRSGWQRHSGVGKRTAAWYQPVSA